MFCPKCKLEFRDGFTYCEDCSCALVEKLDEPPKPEPRPEEKACKLCEAADEFEADIIIAKLELEGIYSFKKYRGSDSYNKIFLGRTILGVDVIVGESDYDTAREILRAR